MDERLAIVGSGAIACGLAATAAHHGPVLLLARSRDSAERARATVERTLGRLGAEVDPASTFRSSPTPQALAQATFVVEAVVEDHEIKAGLLAELDLIVGPATLLASTTSSLSVERLAEASGRPERFVGLHVFNPVTKMQLVELIFPAAATEDTRAASARAVRDLREDARRGPRHPGLRRQSPALPLSLQRGLACSKRPAWIRQSIDTCMQLGAGHPMGPLALLDLVGLDVSKAIGETIGETIPDRIESLVAEGALGRKSKRGFHAY